MYVESGADISKCKKYRYKLWRTWDRALPVLVIIMLNPSTADGREDDPTIRSCVRLAKARGFGGIVIVNMYAWRATEPRDLPGLPSKARGPGNARTVAEVIPGGVVVCAWGASKYARAAEPGMMSAIRLLKSRAYCFGWTKSGAPRHPLYVRTDAKLKIYWSRENDHPRRCHR